MLKFSMFKFLKFQDKNNDEKNYKMTISDKTINIQKLDPPIDQNSNEDSNNIENLKKNLLKIKKIQNFFFVMTIIFFLSHLIYLFYTKEAKYTSFLFICAFGLSLGFDNSGISRMNACLTLSLLLIPLIYNTLFETKVSDLDKIMFILFSTLLNFYMIYIFNALTIFLLISSSLLTLLIIILGKTYFLPENLSNHINFYV